MRGKVAFEVADDSGNSTGEEAEATTNAPDEKWVEAVKTRKYFLMKFVGLVGLFAKEQGMNIGAIEKNDPVAGEFRVKNRDKIDIGTVVGRFPFAPNSDSI